MRQETQFCWADDEHFKNIWFGERGLIVGRGNSEDYERNKKLDKFEGKIIGCNRAYKTVKCDAIVWMDPRTFFTPYREELYEVQKDTLLFAVNPHYQLYGLTIWGLEARKPERCSESFDSGFYPCSLSGYIALNVALLMGLNPIWLLGFLPKPILAKSNETFKYIYDWCQKNKRTVYTADKGSSLKHFFKYKPLPLDGRKRTKKSDLNLDNFYISVQEDFGILNKKEV